MTISAFLLALGLTVRVVRFLNSDALAQPLRDLVARRYGEASKAAYLLGCPWCASPYIAVPATLAAYYAGNHPVFVVLAAAASISYLVGLVSINLDDDH